MILRLFARVAPIAMIVPLGGCYVSVTDESVADMPTGYICRLLDGREYITSPNEQRALYAEIERRNATCVDGTHKVILSTGS